ncbi:MAG: septum formation initiator family protein [Eubacterium sp.]|nr:septum formation initiator family protein [Eubacterium sp.]
MRRKGGALKWLLVFVILAMLITMIAGFKMKTRLSEGAAQIEKLQQQTDEENRRAEELKEMEDYVKSDEYLKQIAKDKLGLIDSNEIIFKESKE